MKRILMSTCVIISLGLLAACGQRISAPGAGVVATQATVATVTPEATASPTVTSTPVPTATHSPQTPPTSVPVKPTVVPPHATATPTAPAAPNVSGTWTAYGPSILTNTGNDCYTLILIQAVNSTNVVGSFGDSRGPCTTSYLGVVGTFTGSQLVMKDILASSARLTFTQPAQPQTPHSSCGTTTIALTYDTSSLMTGTVTNCVTVSLQFQR